MHLRHWLWPLAPTLQAIVRQGLWMTAKEPKANATSTSSPSPDQGFESNRSPVSMASSVSLQSDRSEDSQHCHHGRHHRESRGHMKINLPVFNDEDMKDAITYKSWRWDLTVYHWVGCQDHTLLPYTIWSLQGYPGEFMRTSGMDITLDNVLTILDEHYNNVKALDALSQELFQLQMGEKETVSEWGVQLSSHHQVLAASFPECFPLIMWLSWSMNTSMVGYPNVSRPWWPIWRPAHRRRHILSASHEGSWKGILHGTLLKPYHW